MGVVSLIMTMLFNSSKTKYRWKESAIFLFLAICSALELGCGSSSPRYRSEETHSPYVVQQDDEFRFATKVRAEEKAEDDRKVDIQKTKRDLTHKKGVYSNLTPSGIDRDKVLLSVVGFLGVPYAFGGTSKEGIDCSGFTLKVYDDAVKKPLPRSTVEQYEMGKAVSMNNLQFGDLVFFNTTGRSPSHVGIYIEDDVFAHASVSYGVTFSSLESTYYKKRFIGARRIAR